MSRLLRRNGNTLTTNIHSDDSETAPILNRISKSYAHQKCPNVTFTIHGLFQRTYPNGNNEVCDEDLVEQMLFKPMLQIAKAPNNRYMPKVKSVTVELEGCNETTTNNLHTSQQVPHVTDENVPQHVYEFEAREPQWHIDEVYLPDQTRNQLQIALTLISHRDILINNWGLKHVLRKATGLVLNFFGPPGTGKSITAEAVASHLGKKIIIVNYADLESKYVGDTPKNIRRAFRQAKEQDAVLIFDEADSFLGHRLTNITQAADYGVNVTRSTMFMEIESFSGVLIFTTNLLQNYDAAFKRRILASIAFDYPDQKGREKLWQLHIPPEMPIDHNVITPSLLAERFINLTGADIKDMVVSAATAAITHKRGCVQLTDFEIAYEAIRARYATSGTSLEVAVCGE